MSSRSAASTTSATLSIRECLRLEPFTGVEWTGMPERGIIASILLTGDARHAQLLRQDPDLRELFASTFGAPVEAGCNKAAAARRLHVHVNAPKYRLGRLHQLTGHDLPRGNSPWSWP